MAEIVSHDHTCAVLYNKRYDRAFGPVIRPTGMLRDPLAAAESFLAWVENHEPERWIEDLPAPLVERLYESWEEATNKAETDALKAAGR